MKIQTEIFNDIRYCHPECSYLEGDPESVQQVCGLDHQVLDFYDGPIAQCSEDDELRSQEVV